MNYPSSKHYSQIYISENAHKAIYSQDTYLQNTSEPQQNWKHWVLLDGWCGEECCVVRNSQFHKQSTHPISFPCVTYSQKFFAEQHFLNGVVYRLEAFWHSPCASCGIMKDVTLTKQTQTFALLPIKCASSRRLLVLLKTYPLFWLCTFNCLDQFTMFVNFLRDCLILYSVCPL